MRQHIAEGNDDVAIGDALEQIRCNLPQLAQGVASDFQLSLDSRLTVVVSEVLFHGTPLQKSRYATQRNEREIEIDVRPALHRPGP